MFSLPRTHAPRNLADCSVSVPKPIEVSSESGSCANFRIVSDGPRSASGGMIALTRLRPAGVRRPSATTRRSAGRPANDPVDDPQQMRVVEERGVGLLELAGALDVDLVGPLTMISVTAGSSQERLERSVAEDVVGDLPLQPLTLARAQRHLLRVQLLAHEPANARFQLVVPSRLRNAAPSRAMHARWILHFSSACGSRARAWTDSRPT